MIGATGGIGEMLTRRVGENQRGTEASLAMHPLGCLASPVDITWAVAWLLDPTHSWITGQAIGVDGGVSTPKTAR